MRRVAVTGMGIVSAIGASVDAVAESLRAGRSGIVAAPKYAEGYACCSAVPRTASIRRS